MSDRVMVTKAKLDSLAEAVGSKSGLGIPLTIEGMEDAVLGIETGITPSGTLAINRNGTHNVTNYASARVNVRPRLHEATVHPLTIMRRVSPDEGYDGLLAVNVEAMDLIERTVTPSESEQVVVPLGWATVESVGDFSQHHTSRLSLYFENSIASYEGRLMRLVGYVTDYEGAKTSQFDATFTPDFFDGNFARVFPSNGDASSYADVYTSTITFYLNSGCSAIDVTLYAYEEHDGLSQVTVEPIPSNYGLITWDGSSLTVS